MLVRNLTVTTLILFVVFIINLLVSLRANADTIKDVQLWLARSCVGEAGWDSDLTGECAGILHVYAKRSLISNVDILRQAKRYSAAIKQIPGRNNPWIMHLRPNGAKPKKWPSKLNWGRYAGHWQRVYKYVGDFLDGEVSDPFPLAVHYGSRIDKPGPNFVLLKTKTRNRFYSVRGAL